MITSFYNFDPATDFVDYLDFVNNPHKPIHDNFGLWLPFIQKENIAHPVENVWPRKFKYFSICHMIRGKGFYWDQETGQVIKIKAGQGLIMIPEKIHCYGGESRAFVEDSISFCGPIAENLMKCGLLEPGVIEIGKIRKLLPIIDAAMNPDEESQMRAGILLQQLLLDLKQQNRHIDTSAPSHILVLKLIDEFSRNLAKNWSAEEMANYCHLCPRHFRKVFTNIAGMTPKKYLDELKFNKAAELLRETNRSIASISMQIGFTDPLHFSRRFKQLKGQSPDHFRKNN